MPYLTQESRTKIRLASSGQLNYIIHQIIDEYLEDNGLSYETLNSILGVLTAVQLEIYRRLAAPYEDRKKDENGDVYPYIAYVPEFQSERLTDLEQTTRTFEDMLSDIQIEAERKG